MIEKPILVNYVEDFDCYGVVDESGDSYLYPMDDFDKNPIETISVDLFDSKHLPRINKKR